jgi:hypothetical protein
MLECPTFAYSVIIHFAYSVIIRVTVKCAPDWRDVRDRVAASLWIVKHRVRWGTSRGSGCTLLKVAGESEYVVENRARWGGSLVCKRHRYQVNDKLMPRSREFIAVSKLERIYLHTAKCPAWACMRTVSGEQGTV